MPPLGDGDGSDVRPNPILEVAPEPDAPEVILNSLKVIGASMVYEPAGPLRNVNAPLVPTSAVATSDPMPRFSIPAGSRRTVRLVSASASPSTTPEIRAVGTGVSVTSTDGRSVPYVTLTVAASVAEVAFG